MNDFDAEGPLENEWEEGGELSWNEFDWEQYLREQDEVVSLYLSHYEKLKERPDRVDETARLMGWDHVEITSEPDEEASGFGTLEPYTVHKNPVYIATKALFLGLERAWQARMSDAIRIRPGEAFAFRGTLHRAEDQAVLAIQALDLGDYALAVSLFKRALRELNGLLANVDRLREASGSALGTLRDDTRARLFDLREIWLRVVDECRDEISRHIDEEN